MSLAFSPLEEYYLRLEPQRTRRRQAVLLQIRDQIYGSSVKVSTSEFFHGFVVRTITSTIPTLRAGEAKLEFKAPCNLEQSNSITLFDAQSITFQRRQ